jgi:hypothetical protein
MSRFYSLIPLIAAFALPALPLAAMDRAHELTAPRLVGQVLVGTSGFEPGVAAEWRVSDPLCVLRPEVFINEDARPGFGASVTWELSFLNLPERQSITFGPRVVYHNSDDSGWEADAMAIWHFDLIPSQRGRHFLEVIGTAGALQDEEDDENDTIIGVSAGIAYGFQF